MASILVRTATLDDSVAITAVHTSNVGRWQQLMPSGQVRDVAYGELSLYERWQYGGPWMSVETCAVHLTHLLRGAGIPIVAEIAGQVVGHGEAFSGEEPAPFGKHLQVSVLYVHAEFAGQGVEQALLAHVVATARDLGCQRVCLNNEEARAFYEGEGWRRLAVTRPVSWLPRTGQAFYQSTPHPNPDPGQIKGWAMPLGRGQSARQEWESRWPALWMAVPQLRDRRVERFKFSVAGGTLFVMYAESIYDQRWANVYVWTGTPFTGPMLTAVNDRAHKLGFRRLSSVVVGESLAFLGPDAEPEGEPAGVFCIELG